MQATSILHGKTSHGREGRARARTEVGRNELEGDVQSATVASSAPGTEKEDGREKA